MVPNIHQYQLYAMLGVGSSGRCSQLLPQKFDTHLLKMVSGWTWVPGTFLVSATRILPESYPHPAFALVSSFFAATRILPESHPRPARVCYTW